MSKISVSPAANKFIRMIILLCFSPFIEAQIVEVEIKEWYKNKKSAFSFTFDDSYMTDFIYTHPVLEQHGFKATFYVIPGELQDTLPGNWRYATWGHYKILAQKGHEIGSHTMTHPYLTTLPVGNEYTPGTLTYEIFKPKQRIEEKIPGYKPLTFAYPYTAHNSIVRDITDNYYISGRAGGDSPNSASLTHTQLYSIKSKILHFNLPRNSVSADDDELIDFKNYVSSGINSGGWSLLLAHEVYPFSELQWALGQNAYYPMTTEWLNTFCQWLKQKETNNDVWVATAADVVKYMHERDNVTFQIIAQNEFSIELLPSHNLDNAIYNHELTVDISLPSNWEQVVITQGDWTDTLETFYKNGKHWVRTDILPGGGNIILQKLNSASTYAVSGTVSYHNTLLSSVENVQVVLTKPDNSTETVMTGQNGSYTFTGLQPGNYSLSFSKSGGFQSVNATDALLVFKYFTGEIIFDDFQLLAGDVNNSGTINATDALLILRRAAGLQSSFPVPDWVFLNPTENITITNSNVYKNVECILAGDVNMSYSGGGLAPVIGYNNLGR